MNARWFTLAVLLLCTFVGNDAVLAQEVSSANADPVLGVWRWGSGELVTVTPTSFSSTSGNKGEWKFLRTSDGDRVYQFQWDGKGWIDTLILTNDSKRLSGKNNVGIGITAERVKERKTGLPAAKNGQMTKAGPAATSDPIEGEWHDFNDHVLTIQAGGIMTSDKGSTGKWIYLKNPEVERKYRMQWDGSPLIDTMTLSRDAKKLEGKNNKGARVGATRVPTLTQ